MTPLERLVRAVLLFHGNGPWLPEKSDEWWTLTSNREATTRVLCDLARRLLKENQP